MADAQQPAPAAPAPADRSPADSLPHLTRQRVLAGDADLRRRVLYLMLFRLVLISLVLGMTTVLSWLSDVDPWAPSSLILLGIVIGTYLLTIIYAIALRGGADPRRLADVQVAIDLGTTALLVHVTGGAQSAYAFFFPLSIISAAIVRFRVGAVAVAVASSLLFLAVALLGWFEILPAPAGQRILPSEISTLGLFRALALNLAAFGGVAILAVNLGGQIQRTAASLESQRTAAADLFALHEDIVRSLSSGLVTLGLDDRVLALNQAASEILSLQPSVAIGRAVAVAIPGLERKLETLGAHDSLRRDNLIITREDGSELVLGISVSPLRNNREEVIGRIVNFQDLTELHRMEAQVKRSERLALIGTLAAGVAHEIRNPLASISGSIELLGSAPQVDADDKALMQIVMREIERLNGLISDLLDYTNPQPRELVRFDLAGMVTETLRVFQQDRGFEGVRAQLRSGGGEPVEIVGDPAKLRQVLWNLLRNAAEAAQRGQGNVVVSVRRRGELAEVLIEDDGPGIAPENLERVFDPFFTTKSRGSGLGLATCHSIVSEHGGHISVESTPGAGSQFTVQLPLASAARPRVYSTAS